MTKINLLRNELKTIEKLNGGMLTPQAVLEAARNESSILHKYFEWEDAQASEKYRLWQARQLISSVRVQIEGVETDAYWNATISVNEEKVQGYFSTEKMLSDESIYVKVLETAVSELKYWKSKYKELKEVKELINEKALEKYV